MKVLCTKTNTVHNIDPDKVTQEQIDNLALDPTVFKAKPSADKGKTAEVDKK